MSRSPVAAFEDLLGIVSDGEIGRVAGLDPKQVYAYRRWHRIPGATNHNAAGAELRRDLLELLVVPHTVSEAHEELGGIIGTLKQMVLRLARRGHLRRVGRRPRLPGTPGQPERVWQVSSACVGDVDPDAWHTVRP